MTDLPGTNLPGTMRIDSNIIPDIDADAAGVAHDQPSRLVFAYLFSPDGTGTRMTEEAALIWLKTPAPATTEFIWLHFSNPHHIGKKWLEYIELSPSFKEVLHEERRSSRLSHSHLGLFAVLNEVPEETMPSGTSELATLWISVRQHWLLSAWNHSFRAVKALDALLADGKVLFHNPAALTVYFLNQQADALVHQLRQAADIANHVEAMLLTDRLPKRADLGGLRRNLLRLQRLLAPEPAALFRLVNRLPHWVQEEDADYLHLATENFSVILRDMNGLQDRIELLEDEITARVAEKTNRNVFILTSVTVLSLPSTIVAALFGMNVGGLPFRYAAFGFWLVFALAIALTFMTLLWIMRFLRD